MELKDCPYCDNEQIIKKGFRYTQKKGILQRYFCLECNKHFQENWEDFSRHHIPYDTIIRIMELHYKGYSLRRIAKLIGVSHMTISNIIKHQHNVYGEEYCKELFS